MIKDQEGRQADVRELTADILLEILEKGGLSHVVLNQALGKYQYLKKQERAWVSKVTQGTLEYLIQLDYVINLYSNVKVEKLKPFIRTLMRMSVYQLLYLDRVPDRAVCFEAVKLAKKRHFHGLTGFVNGVLRTVAREKEQIRFPDDGIRYSVPRWLIRLWGETYPEDTVRRILASFLERSGICVRCSVGRVPMEEIKASLARQGVAVRESGYLEQFLFLEGVDYLEALEAFQKGWIQVQDLSSGLAALAAAPKKGDYCIDVCGAPGGKSLHLAELLGGTGCVEVRDVSQKKLSLIEENIRRAGYSNMKAALMDALTPDPESVEKADVLLADLPCSGLGVIGRKPEIKYRVTPEAIEDLSRLQREILSVVWRYVKPGGTLVYSTCTVSRKENEDNAAWFVKNYPFRAVNLEGRLGGKLRSETMKDGSLQLLPGLGPWDGFFLAVFERTG